ncbi:MAG TPA: hypothetical protein VLI93_02895, partial [Acetobacteraceae bacterium]|nr:hypothetical protein [Acetobacteraceae bacterium]
EIVDRAGYSAAFLALGAAAAIAVTVFALAMPETAPGHTVDKGRSASDANDAIADRSASV